MDNMFEYCFSKTPDRVCSSDFDQQGFDNIDSFLDASLVNIYLPWLFRWIYSTPEWILKKILPAMKGIVDEREALSKQVEAIRSGEDQSYEKSGHKTIFHSLLESNLPTQEKGRERLRDEAFSLVTAGSETTAHTIKTITYFVSADSTVHAKLIQELRDVMPDPEVQPDLPVLEKLPYLTAVIQEGLRLAHPVTHRSCRVFPQRTLYYNGIAIPPGTVVCMTALLLHEKEDIFPEPHIFKPERWLGAPAATQRMQKSLVPFSRGSRGCLGINLAWAELYLILAMVFRRFVFDVERVNRERDIDVDRDMIVAVPKRESKGVIVKVHRVKK